MSADTCAEMVRFGKTVRTCTSAAARVARAFTRRARSPGADTRVAGSGHRINEPLAWRALARRAFDLRISLMMTCPLSDSPQESTATRLACVIMEPVTFDPPALLGDLQGVQELCHCHCALLVFDEIIRQASDLHPGGAQALSGCDSGSGLFREGSCERIPLSAIVGRAEVMRLFEHVFSSFNVAARQSASAACLATVQAISTAGTVSPAWDVLARVLQAKHAGYRLSVVLPACPTDSDFPQWTMLRRSLPDPQEALYSARRNQQETVKRGILLAGQRHDVRCA